MLLDRPPCGVDQGLAATPGEVEAGHGVPVAVDASLGPVDHREEPDPPALEPLADLVPRACNVRLGPPPWPFVLGIEPGHPQPVIERHQQLMWQVGDLMDRWEKLQSADDSLAQTEP